MLGKSDDKNDRQTSGVLIQYLHELSDYLKERNLSKKVVTMAVAVLMLMGLTGVHYRASGSLLPTSGAAAKRELPIYCVQTEKPEIALTFDAAWGDS